MNREELLNKAYNQIESMDEKSLKSYLRYFLERAPEDKIKDFIGINSKASDFEKVEVKHIKMIPEKYVKEKMKEINFSYDR